MCVEALIQSFALSFEPRFSLPVRERPVLSVVEGDRVRGRAAKGRPQRPSPQPSPTLWEREKKALHTMFLLTLVLLAGLGCEAPANGPVAVAQFEPQSPEAASSAAPTSGAPHIVFAEPVYDFGKVEQGKQVTHMFRFTNQGGQELRIESVKTSCGCTAAVISEEVIPSGQEGTISATFDTTHFSGEKAKGITVYSNDPQ